MKPAEGGRLVIRYGQRVQRETAAPRQRLRLYMRAPGLELPFST